MTKEEIEIYAKATAMSFYMLCEHSLGKSKYGSFFGLLAAGFRYTIDLFRKQKPDPAPAQDPKSKEKKEGDNKL